MAKQIINNLESAATVRNKLNDNFTELYEYKASKNHASVDSSFGVASEELFGHIRINPTNGLTINNGILSLAAASESGAGAVQIANSLDSDDPSKVLSAAQGKILGDSVNQLQTDTPPKNHAVNNGDYGLATDALYGHLRVSNGNGLSLVDGTLSLNAATVGNAGAVQLEDTLNSQSSSKALTANMGYYLNQHKAEVFSGTTAPSNDIGSNGDLYILLG